MKYISTLLILIFCSCSKKSNCTYIFNKEQPTHLYFIDIKEKFTPSIDDVRAAEKILNNNIPKWAKTQYENNSACPVIYSNMHKYCKQYVGYFNSEGEKIIYLNAFYNEPPFNESDQMIFFSEALIRGQDGCSNYWSVEINLNTNELMTFMVNSIGG